MRKLALPFLALSLAACGTTAVPVTSTGGPATNTSATPRQTPTVRQPAPQPPPARAPIRPAGEFRTPQVMQMPGLEGVIGATAGDLQRQFGNPRLDVYEGDARKLQFAGEACVLDVYLYPLREGAEPTATYVDARRSSDALDVDRASCVSVLKR